MTEEGKTASTEPKKEEVNSNGTNKNEGGKASEAWGYDLYPERRGTFQRSITNILIGKEGKENIDKLKCEQHVVDCVKNSKYNLNHFESFRFLLNRKTTER